MVDQELQLAQLRVVGGLRQARLAQGGAGDCQRVDRVRLAVGAGALTGVGGHPGADPQHHLARTHQAALRAPVDMAAVLQGEAPLLPLAHLLRPADHALVAGFCSRHGQFVEQLAGGVVNRRGGVGVFVGVDPDRDHFWLPPYPSSLSSVGGSTADRTGWGSRTLLSGHAGNPQSATGDTTHSVSLPEATR